MRGKFFEQFISEGFFWNVGKRYWKIDCYSATGDSLQQITQVNNLPMSIINIKFHPNPSFWNCRRLEAMEEVLHQNIHLLKLDHHFVGIH